MIRPKKSLGQHFLRSKEALAKIVSAAHIARNEMVLEIGPGEGVLTEALLAVGATVLAVETDERCITLLAERFKKEIATKRLSLLQGDIRDSEIQQELFAKKYLGDKNYKLVANIPYYITGMLFRLFLEHLRQPTLLVFLVQKEVAKQAIGQEGKEGILSLAIKAYGDPRFVSTIKREAFSPPPKVDSAIIAVENISRARLGVLPSETYFRVVKAGLRAKRKMLLGNLSQSFSLKREVLVNIFQELHINETVRGEDLGVEQWIELAHKLNKKISTQ